MRKRECCEKKGSGVRVTVDVDVYKIVRCLCAAGVWIVGIIFGAGVAKAYLENQGKGNSIRE